MNFKVFFFFLIALFAFAVADTKEEDGDQHTYTGELKDAPLVSALNARNDAAGSYGGSSYGAGAATVSSS